MRLNATADPARHRAGFVSPEAEACDEQVTLLCVEPELVTEGEVDVHPS